MNGEKLFYGNLDRYEVKKVKAVVDDLKQRDFTVYGYCSKKKLAINLAVEVPEGTSVENTLVALDDVVSNAIKQGAEKKEFNFADPEYNRVEQGLSESLTKRKFVFEDRKTIASLLTKKGVGAYNVAMIEISLYDGQSNLKDAPGYFNV